MYGSKKCGQSKGKGKFHPSQQHDMDDVKPRGKGRMPKVPKKGSSAPGY